MADWTLQNINSSIRLAVNSLRKWRFRPQPPKKRWSKTTFRVLLHQNYTSVTPTTIRRQTTFIMEVKRQKSISSEKSQKSQKNCQKSRFFEKFWLLWFPTSLCAITLLPVLDRTAKQKSWKKFKKLRAGMTFLKKSVFDPPNRQNLFSQAYLGDMTY